MSSMNYPEHGKYEWLPILYDFVVTLKPKRIIEFGPGSGYTTICMAKALKENKPFKKCYDDVAETFRTKPTGNRVLGFVCS